MSAIATHDLNRLQQLYAAGFQDAFIDNALRKIIDHQIARNEADLQRVNIELAQFEQRYRWTSEDFYTRYQSGQIDDTADFMEWNVFCKMRLRITSRLSILRSENNHA